VTLDEVYLFLRVSLLQCLTNAIVVGSPFPSHPTGRSVFPESGGPTVFVPRHAQTLVRT